jgi:hypothetical protein
VTVAYCTIDELADALHTRVTSENTDRLTACVEAAAEELDGWLDRLATDPIAPAPDSPYLVNQDNVFRAVQWFKSSDVALGGGGSSDTGLIVPTEKWQPRSVVPYKQQWGVA